MADEKFKKVLFLLYLGNILVNLFFYALV